MLRKFYLKSLPRGRFEPAITVVRTNTLKGIILVRQIIFFVLLVISSFSNK